MMSPDDKGVLYPLVINQLLHDGYGVFALSLKKIAVPDCETVASNKLLKLVKLGIAVSKYLEESDLNRDFSQIAHAFRQSSQNPDLFVSNPSSNAHPVEPSQQQLQQNGAMSVQLTLGSNQPLKLEPIDPTFNSFGLPLGVYQRQWTQVANRNPINLDGEIHELPSNGSPQKLFECGLCGKVFNRRDKVKRHLSELHHGIKRHQCITCSRLFSRNDKLVRHIATVHQGIKAFGCVHCPRRFSRRWEYQRHMQTTHPNLLSRLPVLIESPKPANQQLQDQTTTDLSSSVAVSVSTSTPAHVKTSPIPTSSSVAASTAANLTSTSTADSSSTSNRGMFPIFPALNSVCQNRYGDELTSCLPNADHGTSTTWMSGSPNNVNPASDSNKPCDSSSTASVTIADNPSSAMPSVATTTSDTHGVFPIFPSTSQAPVTLPTTCSSSNVSFSAANTAVFPTPSPAFTSVTAPYESNYAALTTPSTSSQTQSTCSESTSLTRMLL